MSISCEVFAGVQEHEHKGVDVGDVDEPLADDGSGYDPSMSIEEDYERLEPEAMSEGVHMGLFE